MRLSKSLTGWQLKLNVTKSMCMLIGSRQRVGSKTLHLSLNGNVLKQVPSAKYLGVYIDQHLTWQSHIDYVLRRVRGKVYSINRINPPPMVRKLLYQGYVLPIFDYSDVVWAPTTAKQTRRLERFHSKYATFCTDLSISKYSLTE